MSIQEVISALLVEGVSVNAFQDFMYTNGVEDNIFAQEVLNQLILNEVTHNTSPPPAWTMDDIDSLLDALNSAPQSTPLSLNWGEDSLSQGTVEETPEVLDNNEEEDEFDPWSQRTMELIFPLTDTGCTLIPIVEGQEVMFEPWSPSFQSAVLEQEDIASAAQACLLDGEFKSGKTFQCGKCFAKFPTYELRLRHKLTAHSIAPLKEQPCTSAETMNHIGAGDLRPTEENHVEEHSRDAKNLRYTIRKKSERTYAKNAAVDTTYQVKIHEDYIGQRLLNIRQGLHNMFNEILNLARGDLAGNDLGRVVIHHSGLHDPIVVPLQPWSGLNANTIMDMIERVLNSHQDLDINQSFEITIGLIVLPKGGSRKYITRLTGKDNSVQLKRSLVTIANDDQLCLARSIAVSWAHLMRCSTTKWLDVTKNQTGKSSIELVLEHKLVPMSIYKNICHKKRKTQKKLALALTQKAKVPLDRPASLNDVTAFEEVLGVRVLIISAKLGNKFITSPNTNAMPCIYVYHIDDNHFHAITSITGFFNANFFCSECLKHYAHREKHQCNTTCIVCKLDTCPVTDTMVSCKRCHMTCRSIKCYKLHMTQPTHKKGKNKGKVSGPSQCKKWWKCTTCFKAVNTTKRKPEDHLCGEYLCSSCDKYVLEGHLCYLRATPAKDKFIPKFVFFDFECTQNEMHQCREGYRPFKCVKCQLNGKCKNCLVDKCLNCQTSSCGKLTHKPNFVVAHTVCPECIDKELTPKSICKKCGTRCEQCDRTDLYDNEDQGPCIGTCGFREIIFEGDDTATKFCEWLFSDNHEYFTVVAHNMRGYDGYFLLEYLIDQSIRPANIIYNGSKIMYMKIERGLHMKVIDSMNFLPMKLEALPKAFGLTELKKGWFPHFFNTRDNQEYIGPYPDKSYYGCNFMGTKGREDFISWLNTKKDEVFNFRREILDYCRSDVDILRKACLKFRHLLMSSTGEEIEVLNEKGILKKKWVGAVDPFHSVTIASVCMNVYRTKYLEEEWRVKIKGEWNRAKLVDGKMYTKINDIWKLEEHPNEPEFIRSPIAKIPPGGYKNDQYSQMSIRWLEWVSHRDNVRIQHALNVGEKTFPGTRYKLDGYCAETNTAYEYQGCVFHGCSVCFNEEMTHPLTDRSMKELFTLTLKKKAFIKQQGMKYISIWEHEFKKQCKENPDLGRFVQFLEVSDRLDPRDSFYGGRTNASQLYYKKKEGETIKYVDFTSLYPWVNKYGEFPVGHPSIISKDFKDIGHYYGIAKIKVLPPRGLYHPVLPYRSNGKLKFPLCRTCADTENKHKCTCSARERALTGTWCIPEIQKSVCKGYTILTIYEVYHWEETTKYDPYTKEGGLFSQYINTFLKIKQEASGLPDWIKTKADTNKYISDYFKKEGISLNRVDIMKNPGLRALAKLCLNSFWGKFGQRLNLKQTQFFHETEVNQFFQVFTDPMKDAQNFHIVTDDNIQLEWVYKKDCLPEDNKTNIYLATFTTCWARLKLYSVLEQLDRRVLYYDTDSVIYVSKPGHIDPPLGDCLGDLTNELKQDEHIVEFVSGGPKNYAYITNRGDQTCKVRGFTLNHKNSQVINFETVKDLVTRSPDSVTLTVLKAICQRRDKMKAYALIHIRVAYGLKHLTLSELKRICTEQGINDIYELIMKEMSLIVITNPHKICRDKLKRKLFNREEDKVYQMVYTKRRRLDNNDTEPYGY